MFPSVWSQGDRSQSVDGFCSLFSDSDLDYCMFPILDHPLLLGFVSLFKLFNYSSEPGVGGSHL